MKRRVTYPVTPAEFVDAWQTSETVDEAAAKLNMPKPIAQARAANYRKAGVNLKRMPRRPKNKLNVERLNRRIDEIGGGEKNGPQ